MINESKQGAKNVIKEAESKAKIHSTKRQNLMKARKIWIFGSNSGSYDVRTSNAKRISDLVNEMSVQRICYLMKVSPLSHVLLNEGKRMKPSLLFVRLLTQISNKTLFQNARTQF